MKTFLMMRKLGGPSKWTSRRYSVPLTRRPASAAKKTPKGFQDYVTQYQLAVAQSSLTDNIAIINGLCWGLDKELVQMILSMKDPLKDLKGWIKQASEFHAQ
jgi:hypothetical protein